MKGTILSYSKRMIQGRVHFWNARTTSFIHTIRYANQGFTDKILARSSLDQNFLKFSQPERTLTIF